jgi:hypothetical protein
MKKLYFVISIIVILTLFSSPVVAISKADLISQYKTIIPSPIPTSQIHSWNTPIGKPTIIPPIVPTQSPSGTGSLSILSFPTGALVYLDGALKGFTPITINDVSIGSHLVKLTKIGYNDHTTSVTVIAEKTNTVSATLTSKTGTSVIIPTSIPTPAPTKVPTTVPTRVQSKWSFPLVPESNTKPTIPSWAVVKPTITPTIAPQDPSIAPQDVMDQDWITTTVDDTEGIWGMPSLALDKSGNPHISYSIFNSSSYCLKHATWTGSAWKTETVESGRVGWHNSIAVDKAGNPHISYDDSTNGNLKYARWTGSGWNTEIVDSTDTEPYNSLVLDSAGNPHIIYSNGHTLMYAKKTGMGWVTTAVDSDCGGWAASLALDAADNPHISYSGGYSGGDYDIKYTRWTGSAWKIETIDSVDYPDSHHKIALDAAGNPHIIYSSGDPSYDLKYARWTGSAWKIETVDSIEVHQIIPFALDANGNPHIYSGSKYAKWTGTEWVIVVYKDGPEGVYSIAVDPAGNPHIIFGDYSDSSKGYPEPLILKHAQYKT